MWIILKTKPWLYPSPSKLSIFYAQSVPLQYFLDGLRLKKDSDETVKVIYYKHDGIQIPIILRKEEYKILNKVELLALLPNYEMVAMGSIEEFVLDLLDDDNYKALFEEAILNGADYLEAFSLSMTGKEMTFQSFGNAYYFRPDYEWALKNGCKESELKED